MGIGIRLLFLSTGIALVSIYYFNPLQLKARQPLNFDGYVKPGFEKVQKAFRSNYEKGWDNEGSAFAVCHRGDIVVDLWGGYANYDTGAVWRQDTMAIGFSTTKAATAISLALLVDRGLIKYEDLVIKYWPEFGKHGKENVTVRMLASHQAALAILDEPITFDLIKDWQAMGRAIENQHPNWALSQSVAGYHAITYGFLVDQLVRRVDPQKRSLGQFFHQEIAKPNELEFFIGLPESYERRVAKIFDAPFIRTLIEGLSNRKLLKFLLATAFYKFSASLLSKLIKNPPWMFPDEQGNNYFNNPVLHGLEVGAAVGIGTARDVAKLMCLFGAGKIVSFKTLDLFKTPMLVKNKDLVLGIPMTYGHGFEYSATSDKLTGRYLIGHSGHGGQNAKLDFKHDVAMVYFRNGLSYLVGDFNWSYKHLKRAVAESLNIDL